MQTLSTRITERGQISIPAQVREALGWSSGKKLFWEISDGAECRVFSVVTTQRTGAQAMRGFASTFRRKKSSATWMRELREGEA